MENKNLVRALVAFAAFPYLVAFTPIIFADAVKWWDGSNYRSSGYAYPQPVNSNGRVNAADDIQDTTCGSSTTALPTKACKLADINAHADNTETVWIDYGTATDGAGADLPAGTGRQFGIDANLNTLECISTSGGQGISIVCLVD